MVPPAPKLTFHKKAAAVLRENYTILRAMMTQMETEETAIKKRLTAVYYMARKYEVFNTYEDLVELLAETGAFHDCPRGSDAGSWASASASYSSRTTCSGLPQALALATRAFWLPIVRSSPRGAMMADETGDAARHTQLCTLYKVLLSSGVPVVVYAGMDTLPRSTAAVIKGALLHRLALDSIDAARVACTRMF